jgi:hypothetical protein
LDVYRRNTARIPSVTAAVVPEPVYSRAEYEERILGTIYRDLAPYDPEGILRHEWVNARGCTARFDRMSLEIRVLDVQECPAADIAVAAAIRGVLEAVVAGRLGNLERMRAWPTDRLAAILSDVIRDADETLIADADYGSALGCPASRPRRAIDLWSALLAAPGVGAEGGADWAPALDVILDQGCLARRLLRRLDGDVDHDSLSRIFAELCDCLADGKMFR